MVNNHSNSELRKSLNLIIIAITFGMSFFSVIGTPIGAAPFTGFIRALGAGDLIYGIVMAMPVLGGIIQVFASYYIETTGKRKGLFIVCGFIHRLLWIPIALVPFFFKGTNISYAIWIVTILITVSVSCNYVTSVSFWSWMGALVPSDIAGRFFSRRTMISTITTVITGLVVGKFLDSYSGLDGFAIVFITVALLGSVDILCFFWVKHPKIQVPEQKTPFFTFFKEPFTNKNYMRFVVFVSVWMFGVNFAGPFFNVYMLEHLNMGYLTISIVTQLLSSITTVVSIRYWGRLVDRFGNKPVTKICCTMAVILPFLWLFATPQNYYILFFMNFLSGICWPGLDMANLNLSVWLAPEKNRSIYVAVFALVTATFGVAFAYICGGLFMEVFRPILDISNIPFVLGQKLNAFHLLFIASGLIRLFATYAILPRVKEEGSEEATVLIKSIRESKKI